MEKAAAEEAEAEAEAAKAPKPSKEYTEARLQVSYSVRGGSTI